MELAKTSDNLRKQIEKKRKWLEREGDKELEERERCCRNSHDFRSFAT